MTVGGDDKVRTEPRMPSLELTTWPRPVWSPILVVTLLGFLYLAIALTVYGATTDPRALLVGAAAVPLLIILVPQLFQRSYDLLAPLNFVALSVVFGVTLRSLYVATVETRTTREVLLHGEPPEFLLPAVGLISAALACLVLGYLIRWPRLPLPEARIHRLDEWSGRRIGVVVSVLVAVAAVCALLYMDRVGVVVESMRRFSAVRRFEVENAEYRYAAMGYYLWGMSLLSYAFYLLWTYFAFSRRPLLSRLGAVSLAIGLLAAFPPLVTSSRTGMLLLLLYAALIWNYSRRRLTGRWIAMAVVFALVVLTAMAALRGVDQQPGSTQLELRAGTAAKAVLGNRNWLGVAKTAHIMEAVPDELEYQKGKTLVTWLFAPIPRTLWLDKPVIRVGLNLGQEIFHKEKAQSGVPPGFVGELYLNFGVLGVLAGMFCLGAVLRILYASFGPLLGSSPSALLIYTVIVFPLAFTLVTTDVSGSVIQCGRSLITLAVLLPAVGWQRSSRPTEPDIQGGRGGDPTGRVAP